MWKAQLVVSVIYFLHIYDNWILRVVFGHLVAFYRTPAYSLVMSPAIKGRSVELQHGSVTLTDIAEMYIKFEFHFNADLSYVNFG